MGRFGASSGDAAVQWQPRGRVCTLLFDGSVVRRVRLWPWTRVPWSRRVRYRRACVLGGCARWVGRELSLRAQALPGEVQDDGEDDDHEHRGHRYGVVDDEVEDE